MRYITGSQWRFMRWEVICSSFLVLVTIRAAAFCNLSNFLICLSGNPNNSELLQSSLDDTNAWITLRRDSLVRYFSIFPMFRKWYAEDWQIEFICFYVVRCGSKITPRFFILAEGDTLSTPICSDKGSTLGFCISVLLTLKLWFAHVALP